MEIFDTDSEEVRVVGTDAAVPQGVRQSLSPWEADVQTVTYEGSHDAIESLASQVASAGYEVRVDYSRPVARLEYEADPDGDGHTSYGSVWELRGNDVSKSIASHESLSNFSSLIIEIDEVMDGKNKDYQPGKVNGTNRSAISKWMESRSLDNAVIQYIALRGVGTTTYLEAGYRIIYTREVSNVSEQTAAMSGVMEVGSPPLSSSAKFSLPSGEWLKKAPQVYDLGHGRFKITSEWVWAEEWSNLLYGGSWIPSIS